jgi:hypothetical protein
MFKKFVDRSNCIELIEETSDELNAVHKVTFRVTDADAWGAALVNLLQFADEEEEYVVSVRKEYFLKEGKPSFLWNMMIWGNYETASVDLGPLMIGARAAKKVVAPVASVVPETPAPAEVENPQSYIISVKTVMAEDGPRQIKKVPLPFRRGLRKNPGDVTKKMGDNRLGAYVDGVTG